MQNSDGGSAPQSEAPPSAASALGVTPRASASLPTHRPLWTYVLLVANAAIWLAMEAYGGSQDISTLIRFGAKFNPLIVAGEYWRLFTPMFLHIGFIHLAFNSYALYLFGQDVEALYGRTRFLVLYLISGVGGTVASFLGNDRVSAGASGAIFGLVGAMLVFFYIYRDRLGRWGQARLRSLVFVAGLNLLFGFTASGIDNLGHIGGMVTGMALGWAYLPHYRVLPSPSAYEAPRMAVEAPRLRAWLVALGMIALFGVLTLMGVQAWAGRYGMDPWALLG